MFALNFASLPRNKFALQQICQHVEIKNWSTLPPAHPVHTLNKNNNNTNRATHRAPIPTQGCNCVWIAQENYVIFIFMCVKCSVRCFICLYLVDDRILLQRLDASGRRRVSYSAIIQNVRIQMRWRRAHKHVKTTIYRSSNYSSISQFARWKQTHQTHISLPQFGHILGENLFILSHAFAPAALF